MITVDTRSADVAVPAHLKDRESVDFILGQVPTPKLTCGGNGIYSPMRFGGAMFDCFFPWESIVRISGHDAVIQFKINTAAPGPVAADATQGVAGEVPRKKGRPNLRVVK